jgi:hypothetical protein
MDKVINAIPSILNTWKKHVDKETFFAKFREITEYGCMQTVPRLGRTFRNVDYKCIFNVPLNNSEDPPYGCMIHFHCFVNKEPYLDLKPLACSLFPIDIIKLDDKSRFVFASTRKTGGMLRWGAYYDLSCVYKPKGRASKKYIPAYINDKSLLTPIP